MAEAEALPRWAGLRERDRRLRGERMLWAQARGLDGRVPLLVIVALVLATHREHAELVAEQLTSLKLTVTIEPAP